MTRVAVVSAVTASLAIAGWVTVNALADPGQPGTPPTIYRTVTRVVDRRIEGWNVTIWHAHAVANRRALNLSVLRQHRLAHALARETRTFEQARRDYRDDYGITTDPLARNFLCIHGHEGDWRANTGNGYHGGLQMNAGFMGSYGAAFVRAYGDAENWPAYVQLVVAEVAYYSGRGYGPWPQTSRMCGL